MIVAISTLLTIAGLWFVLRKYFTAGVTVVTLLLLFAGTNFFVMTVYSGAIQASILLALMVVVVWMTQRWYDKPGWVEAVMTGLAMGTLVFIKPSGFASVLLFFFWGAYNRETFSHKWKLFNQNRIQVLMILMLFIVGIALRLIYPQAFAGSWFCDYVQHKRVIYLLAPNLWLVLFSIKNGWLIYTPLVLLSIPGFYILAERNKPIFYATFLYSLVFTLMLASSPDVATPDNFSQQRMSEIFAVLFIPIGYFVSWVHEGRWIRRSFYGILITAICGLSLFQTWQYRTKILNPWFTTPEYYEAAFLKTAVNAKTRLLQEFYNLDMSSFLSNENDFKISTIIFDGFENSPGGFQGHMQAKIVHTGNGAMRLDTGLRFTPDLGLKISGLPKDYPLGIRFSISVYSETDFKINPANIVVSLRHQGQLFRYKAISLQGMPLSKGNWNIVKLDYVIPRLFDPDDDLIAYFWYTGNSAIYVDDLRVELFENKE